MPKDPLTVPLEIQVHIPGSNALREDKTRHHNTSVFADGKAVLPHDEYKQALEKVIQQDFFPELLGDDGVSTVAKSLSTTAGSLSSFHKNVTSDQHVQLQNRCIDRSLSLRLHAEKKYRKKTTDQSSFDECEVRNPLFFDPPTLSKKREAPETLLLDQDASSSEKLQNVAFAATRLESPRRSLPPVPNHWEEESFAGASDSMTDLDSTVVASIRCEIRQTRLQRQPCPSLPPALPFSYHLPPTSARELHAAALLETKRKRPVQKAKLSTRRKPKQQSPSLGRALKRAYSKKSKRSKKYVPF